MAKKITLELEVEKEIKGEMDGYPVEVLLIKQVAYRPSYPYSIMVVSGQTRMTLEIRNATSREEAEELLRSYL
jgi:hypothetical protein